VFFIGGKRMLLTLKNIGLEEGNEDNVVIDFSFEGNRMQIKHGQMKMTTEEWIASRSIGDEKMVNRIIENELKHFLSCEVEGE
jgi:hypothetical protein